MNLIGRASVSDDARWKVYNRIAWKILPLLLLGYLCANIDRVNVAFAKLQMSSAIGMTEAMYGFGAGIFFVSYALAEIPSNMILYRVGPRLWLSRIMIVWGLISAATLFVQTPVQFYAIRFVLGIAEAGFYPGALLFMTYWFPSRLRAQAVAVMILGSTLASMIGSPLSGAIMSYMNDLAGLAGWQWVFLIEGLPATVLGIVLLVRLRNGPADAAWLNAEEKAIVIADLEAENRIHTEAGRHRFGQAFRNPNIWCIIVANFCNLSTLYGIQFWLPTVIQKLGGTSIFMTGLIAAGLALIPCFVLFANARHSDRTKERRWHAAFGFALSATGLCLSAASGGNIYVTLIGLVMASSGQVICSNTIFALPGTFVSGAAAAAAFALITTIGNFAGYTTPYLFGVMREATGSFSAGFYAMGAVALVGAITILATPALRRNSRVEEADVPLAAEA
jgi:sugar phosphate permease